MRLRFKKVPDHPKVSILNTELISFHCKPLPPNFTLRPSPASVPACLGRGPVRRLSRFSTQHAPSRTFLFPLARCSALIAALFQSCVPGPVPTFLKM